ncbi:MAG: hypothetical protein IJC59_03190 [Lachnospiraceae bacterium]|nr:hypothetical protein [Lachnospiraceae bacterium]
MTSVLEAKEYIKSFYFKYEIYVNPVMKLLLALLTFLMINRNMGYMEMLNSFMIVLMAALVCSLLPWNFIVVAAAGFILLHSYALAVECALVVLAVFALMFLLYFRFVPGGTLVVLLTPLLFSFGIPFVIPVAVGLLGTPVSILAIVCGLITAFLIGHMEDNLALLSAQDAESSSQKLRIMIDGVLENKSMLVIMVAFAVTVLLVYVIRRLSIRYAWTFAIVGGILANVILLLVCELLLELNLSVVWILVGSLVSGLICKLIQLMCFNVDYERTEMVQFEDDEYYYYVKAVPKNLVAIPEKQVKKINTQHKKTSVKPTKKVNTINTSNGVSRTAPRSSKENQTSK